MQTKPLLKGIIFDMDGVIIQTCKLHELAWKKAGDMLHYSWPTNIDFRKEVFGTVSADSAKILFHADLTTEELNKLITVKDHAYEVLLKEKLKSIAVPGISEFLSELKREGFKIALATSARREEAELVLQQLEIDHFFDVKIDISYVTKAKPDPEIYLTTLKHLDLSCEECVAFEDSLSGVRAVRGANIDCILVKTTMDEHKVIQENLKCILAIDDFQNICAESLIESIKKMQIPA